MSHAIRVTHEDVFKSGVADDEHRVPVACQQGSSLARILSTAPSGSPAARAAFLAHLDDVSVRLIEDDDTSANDDSNRFSIPKLGKGKMERTNDKLVWVFDEGKYRLEYDLRRRPNEPFTD